MNEHFVTLIKRGMAKKKLTPNRLAIETRIARDRIYRYLNRTNESLHSGALATIFEYLDIEVKFKDPEF